MPVELDLFAVLGLPRCYRVNREDLERRYHERSRLLHPDRFARATPRERRLAMERTTRLNEAYRTLRDPWRRAEYLVSLLDGEARPADPGVAPSFLEEQLALRESLAAARAARDAGALAALAGSTREALAALEGEVARHLAAEKPSHESLEAARGALVRARYYRAMLDEAGAAIELRASR